MNPEERMQLVAQLLEEEYGAGEQGETGRGDPFRTLIGCVLSHRTRDANTARAAEALFNEVTTPEEILSLEPDELKTLIRCSGFYNQKARNITAICQDLVDNHGSTVPDDRETLLGLRGVGPKTADIVLSHAFNVPAIAVDVHVARVARRLGFADLNAGPEEVKAALEQLVPPERYRFIDNGFVRHGKAYCRKTNPRCGECPLRGVCGNPQN
ncbi:Endonuclease III [subsurface metagenome]